MPEDIQRFFPHQPDMVLLELGDSQLLGGHEEARPGLLRPPASLAASYSIGLLVLAFV